jgi:hypothetical protein
MTLYFLPDGIFIYDASGVGHVGYDALHLEVGISRFIEDSNVPHDAHVIDHTWQYTNKDGSADRRFADNRQLPVCAYGQVRITSSAGLQIFLQTSREHAAETFGAKIKHGSDIMLQAATSIESGDDRLLVFVEKDEWESATKMAAKMWQDIGGKLAAVFHHTNRAIAGIFGEENTVIYRFLQILFYGTVAVAFLVVLFLLTRFLLQVL